MLPQVKSSDFLLLFTWSVIAPKAGVMVIFDHSDYGLILKKVIKTDRKKRTFCAQGMNSLSIQATELKNIPFSRLKGIVIWSFKD